MSTAPKTIFCEVYMLFLGSMGERMQGSWNTSGQILQQLEEAERSRTAAPDRPERPGKSTLCHDSS
jgi:hypothetical protein